jgi:hypothetical protein
MILRKYSRSMAYDTQLCFNFKRSLELHDLNLRVVCGAEMLAYFHDFFVPSHIFKDELTPISTNCFVLF